MNFNITSGPTAIAQKVVIYGVEGIGKSTFASQFPKPVFIDTEGSTKNMDVKRLPKPTSWQMILDEVEHVKQKMEWKTLIIDTADWAETLTNNAVIARNNINSIEDLSYGKGYTMVKEEFGKLLNKLSDLTDLGINVVVTAHAEIKKFEKPDEMGAFDRYQLKLSKQSAPLLKEWADMLLFANYETTIVTDAKTQSKKATGGQRVMFTTHHPVWDAKNRHDLPDKLPFDFANIAHIFQAPVTVPEPEPQGGNWVPGGGEIVGENQFAREPSAIDPEIDPALAQLMAANEVTEDEIKAIVVEKGYMPPETPVKDYPDELVQGGLVAQWNNIFEQIKAKRAY
ncbi:MAG TPA: hypothetical protein DCZ00_05800 [Lactococcus sp.]|uniref:ATP-binding protein n=1 Tax=Lactococcus TaxID=1357 RepID=UPI000E889DCF|nr:MULTISPECIES: ATP-binding protein [Lactococcus]HAP15100.1 hypothetical protein [Lactococcus sp.]HBC90942.1 hypothetical protein [Lactococcus sp.]